MVSPALMRIAAAAARSGASARSLRYYEQQGLLTPLRDTNGYRLYDEVLVVRARNIKDLLEVGLTVDDLRDPVLNSCLDRPLADAPHCADQLHTARRRLAGLDERIERLRTLRERLAHYSADLEASLDAQANQADQASPA